MILRVDTGKEEKKKKKNEGDQHHQHHAVPGICVCRHEHRCDHDLPMFVREPLHIFITESRSN